jgi:hypothetical protein
VFTSLFFLIGFSWYSINTKEKGPCQFLLDVTTWSDVLAETGVSVDSGRTAIVTSNRLFLPSSSETNIVYVLLAVPNSP